MKIWKKKIWKKNHQNYRSFDERQEGKSCFSMSLKQTLATRIVWCCADVGHFWPRSEAFNFWKVSSLHELLQHVLSCYSWLKIECLQTCWKFGCQNSLMLCLCGTLLAKIRDVQFLSFIFNFASRNSKRRLKTESLRYCSNFGYQNSLMLCWCGTLLAKIRGVQFLKGFIFSWTAATCSFMLFLIENWMSPNLLKVWLPE